MNGSSEPAAFFMLLFLKRSCVFDGSFGALIATELFLRYNKKGSLPERK